MSFRLPPRVQVWPVVAAALLIAPHAALAKRAPEPRRVLPAAPVALADVEDAGAIVTDGHVRKVYGIESRTLRRWWSMTPRAATQSRAPARQIALDFLRSHADELGLDAADPAAGLELAYEKPSPSGTHLRWNQHVAGVPVWRSEIVVKVSNGAVSSVHNNLRPRFRLVTQPAFDAARAVEIGVATIQPSGRPLGDYAAELSVVQLASGQPRLVYRVEVPNEEPMGDWLVLVDARTGAVLGAEDRLVYATGTGQVFDPDPESKTGITNLPDNNDSNSGIPFPGAYDIRTLLDITLSAGVYSLSGPFARMIDFESPTGAPVTATHPDSFRYQREAPGLEDVLVYFHIDSYQRYLQGLGFTAANNRVQELDAHGLNGADNSHYVLASRRIAFGEGGVDDAEDADVVIHEYGHAIQHDIIPGWGGGHQGAMGEGFGDYIAGGYSRALYPNHEPNFMFNWDGHNEFWPGRLLIDPTKHYPENCCDGVHASGTLWCSGLMDAQEELGRTVMDRLVIDHHFAMGTSATMADAANQILQSDIDLYGGAHLQTLVQVFDQWGFVDAEDFLPTISHAPLTDTEDTAGPYVITAVITSVQPLDLSSLALHYGTTGSFTDVLPLLPTGNPNEYAASIPGPLSGVTVQYYLTASDSAGGTATHPAGAPGSFHSFDVGPDTELPVIVHDPVGDFARIQWPATVTATITDNLGVDDGTVAVAWSINGTAQAGFALSRVGSSDVFTADFPSDTTAVAIGDTIRYAITAADEAAVPNVAASPPAGTHGFVIIASRGLVLVIDDDDLAARARSKTLTGEDAGKGGRLVVEQGPGPAETIHAAAAIAGLLDGLGYTVTVEAIGATNPSSWSGYDLIVSSSGGNEGPVANAAYRTALEAWVAGGGKLLVEGGEVVYDAASSPGYPSFAANVLHTNDWDGDESGPLNLLAAQTGHPIANLPNDLPSSLTVAYTGYGSQESFKPLAPAYIVYAVTDEPANGGILVYDDNPAPQSAQVVVLGFDFKDLGTLEQRTALLENVVQYLLAPEAPPQSGINGRVWLAGSTNHGGVLITAQPGGATTTTDATGWFSFSGLYATSYTLTATRAGYASAQRTVVTAQNQITSHQNLVLYPQPQHLQCANPGTAIPDNNAAGVTTTMNVVPAFTLAGVRVSVNIPHTYIGDLIVELRKGPKTVRLHNRTGGGTDNLVASYPPTAVSGPGSLANFIGDPSDGTWTLFVSDNAGADVGNIAQWCLELLGQPDSSQVVSVPDGRAAVAWLGASQPNPLRSSGGAIRYALPSTQRVTLEVYDVTGRKVRTLVDGSREAGTHSVHWDARDAAGRPLSAGVYLYRMRTDGFEATRRTVLVP